MNTNRINVFHVTYCDAVTISITHYLVLYFLPTCDTTLNKNLSHT